MEDLSRDMYGMNLHLHLHLSSHSCFLGAGGMDGWNFWGRGRGILSIYLSIYP